MKEKNARLVYSTEQSIPRKEKPAEVALQRAEVAAGQKVIVKLDRKGRGGKSVTLIAGLQMAPKEKETLLKQLKSRLGTGGALKEGALEIQGDHCSFVMEYLQSIGYRPKRSGG